MSKTKEIKVCPDCGEPVISTMIFMGSEWFCMACKWNGGLFYAESVEWTAKLSARYVELKKQFDEARKDYVPSGGWRDDCEKCKTEKNHLWHLTEEQTIKHEAAKKLLYE